MLGESVINPRRTDKDLFKGEVALVTGAASGIGAATVRALLDRGAAVVGLDINPAITSAFEHPLFQGNMCDMGEEEAICAAVREVRERYGTLQILVMNAGIFPESSDIASMDLNLWQKVFRINLDGNLVLAREAYPLLKQTRGRVVVIGSQRVPAPAGGTSAYSVSKAALVQLARVAALEWSKDQIRVNIVHPGRICDTGVFTEAVLKERARHYGITVEEYKRENLLRDEVRAQDIGEMAAELCGPLFAHSTGLQLPVDGGHKRLI